MFRIQRLTLISILASTIFLSGCQSFPWPSRDTERCVIKLDPVVINDQEYWTGKCRCHSYRISKTELGRVSDSVDKPLAYCDRLVGFRPEEWTDYFVSWFQEIQIWSKQNDKAIKESFE